MLDEISIDNIALIKHANVRFSPRLTCITGESGSGKTALLHAVQLVVGVRAQSSWLREETDELMACARFYIDDSSAKEPIEEKDKSSQKQEVERIVKRSLDSEGRGRVSIDGAPTSVKELVELVGTTLDFCGQHEHQHLLHPSGQLALLFDFGGDELSAMQKEYEQAFNQYVMARNHLKEIEELQSTGVERYEQAQFELDRILEVNPAQGEFEQLQDVLPRFENAENILTATQQVREFLLDDEGVLDLLNSCSFELERLSTQDEKLSSVKARLRSATFELEDVAGELRTYQETIDIDETELQALQERFAQIKSLMRAFGPSIDDVFARKAQAQKVVDAFSSKDELLEEAKKQCQITQQALEKAAQHLYTLEQKVAQELGAAITAKLAALEMRGAEVEITVSPLEQAKWSAAGSTRVEFFYRPSAALSARPLQKIASGGELSRVMLAAKAVESDKGDAKTLVFDEVDAGVGGTAAQALASVLQELAQTHQVICVTHLPQVAVKADTHIVVSKEESKDGMPTTAFNEVAGKKRIEEVARMLSGEKSDASLLHARQLLENSQEG